MCLTDSNKAAKLPIGMILHEILQEFGVKNHRGLAKALPGFHPEHARKFWNGMQLSIRAAEELKKFTRGKYTLDFLLSINRKPKKRRTNSRPSPAARS